MRVTVLLPSRFLYILSSCTLSVCLSNVSNISDQQRHVSSSMQRGDSLDTIFASSPPSDQLDRRSKLRTRKKNSPKHRSDQSANRSWEESSDQESMEMQDLPRSLSPFRHGGLVADVTGNLHRVGDSVILNIDDSSSAAYSSSSDCERRRRRSVCRMDSQDIDDEYEDDDEEEDGDVEEDSEAAGSDDEEELHCDDWEIRMLAAEMERREHSDSASGQHHMSEGNSSGGVRRRRKRSDTEEATTTATEQSEQEVEPHGHRPRASSLDQSKSTRRGRGGFFKALSFDRDKDRL